MDLTPRQYMFTYFLQAKFLWILLNYEKMKIIGASVSEPHTSESNWDFSYIIIIIIFWRTSFRIFSML